MTLHSTHVAYSCNKSENESNNKIIYVYLLLLAHMYVEFVMLVY